MKKQLKANQSKFLISLILLFLVIWVVFNMFSNRNSRTYSSKESLCVDFAQNYLKTIKNTENIHDTASKEWQAAIAIESDLYNMCLLDLNEKALASYETSNIESYLKSYPLINSNEK